MYRISGPHYVSIYKHNDCVISLFGDIHFSKSKSCNNCIKHDNCMNIIRLYDNLKTPSDLFLEAYYFDKKGLDYKNALKWYYSKIVKETDWLKSVINHYKKKMYNRKEHSKQSGVHVHYGDIRSHRSVEFLYWVKDVLTTDKLEALSMEDIELAYNVLKDFKTKNIFKKYADAIVKSNNFKEDISKIFTENAWIYIDEESLTSYQGLSTKIHRIRKQILKLSPNFQTKVIKYHDEITKEILEDYYCYHYTPSRNKILKKLLISQKNLKSEDALIIDVCIDKWLSHFMNLYTLTRMLFNIEKGTSKNISSYTGANHAYSINYFFKTYMKKEIEYLWSYNSETEALQELRCVNIPKTIINEMMK